MFKSFKVVLVGGTRLLYMNYELLIYSTFSSSLHIIINFHKFRGVRVLILLLALMT
jgi:hypothetical protein